MNQFRLDFAHFFDDLMDSALGKSKGLNDLMNRFEKLNRRDFGHSVKRVFKTDKNEYEVFILFSIRKKSKQ